MRSRLQVFHVAGESLPADWSLAERLARSVLSPGGADLLFGLAELVKDRGTFRGVLKQLLLLFRDALVQRSGGKALISGREETVNMLSGGLTRRSLMRMVEETETARTALEQNANTALLSAVYCAGLRYSAGR